MGVENNESIVATTWDSESIAIVREWINGLSDDQKSLFAIIPSIVNGKFTVFMGPDGSKKGWLDADRGEKLRDELIKLLASFNYEDGSNPFDYVEVGYGDFGQKVLRGNCENQYSDDDYYYEPS